MSSSDKSSPVKAVLFDLDGTLLDTAPDLGAALNAVCEQYERPAVTAEVFTPVASHGSRGLLKLAFDDNYTHMETELRHAFLSAYKNNIATHTQPYPGVLELLAVLQRESIKVAIVTNKPERLTHLLLPHFPEFEAIEVVVSGDTLSVAKPSPEPLFYAAEKLGVEPTDCLYVGDAERDIEAGRNAGMVTVLAEYGYISNEDQPQRWQADYHIESPLALLELLAINNS
ncbi:MULTISPECIES: phosphoglycolate phosphatase [Idiomarina]|uniref:phosphoglycolate phosphatase n=1 Tax=Idiomarina abyssalis TaxID=86102 RepID=A0A8I1KIH1_9GAMM|nr:MULTISPECIES: phosphoglycolate phosphatase [Idiomarina]KPD22565.1 phosphoglycolate phosphatase [Idiomarina abyssalis]MBJ7267943.1 phosphoglycolate phosphatase [Idiomarina abyssalis]MBJ7272476.1 phosphoglycolate phosphatase [Idiomarina abyssalis]MBJ7317012.1 phosphoglycolate phosphatase [Idiomarina abyssalis]MDA6066095.1 phosphoglycolate phosphatase [Idiomarina abyssalis]